jgi:protein phosphatase inhibitor 2
MKPRSESESSDQDETCDVDPEERKIFDAKRKAHYNEYYAVKLARKLMEEDEEGDGGDGDGDEDEEEREERDEKFIPKEEIEIMEEA